MDQTTIPWGRLAQVVAGHRGRSKMKPLLLLVAILGLIGCGDSSDSKYYHAFELDESTFDAETIQMIEKDTGLILPDGTRGLNFRYTPPIDPTFAARVEIPRGSRQMVLEQVEAIKEEKINISGGLPEKVSWWSTPKESIIIDRQCYQNNNAYFRAVLTEEGDRTFLLVYHAVL